MCEQSVHDLFNISVVVFLSGFVLIAFSVSRKCSCGTLEFWMIFLTHRRMAKSAKEWQQKTVDCRDVSG